MRVCVITSSYPRRPGDEASVFVKRLVEGLETCGAAGFVVVPRDRDELERETQGAFEVRRYRYGIFGPGRLAFGAGMLPNVRANPFRLFQVPMLVLAAAHSAFLLRSRFDLVHANWLISGVPALLLKVLTRRPYVLSLLGEDAKLIAHPLLRRMFAPVVRGAAAIVTVSDHFAALLAAAYPGLPAATVIPNGVAIREVSEGERRALRADLGAQEGDEILVFVGRVIPLKGVHRLIEMLGRPELSRARLLVIGRLQDSGYHATLENLARSLGVSERVRFRGAVPPETVSAYLAIASASLSPSDFEGRPNALLEALASGALVFCSDIPAHREVVRDGVNGFFLRANAAESAALVRSVLDNTERAETVRRRAADELRGEDWSRCAERHIEVFRRAR